MTRLLDTDTGFSSSADYDALGRAVESRGALGSTQRFEFETVHEVAAFDHLGRPVKVKMAKAAVRHRSYDEVTQRLTRLRSVSGGGKALQDLRYAYDPVGNIVHQRDAAQKTVHAGNAELEAANHYRYDALYRLVEARGREHAGQNSGAQGAADFQMVPRADPANPKALRRYTQTYRYDHAGNIVQLARHAGTGSFRRHYSYAAGGNRLLATGRRLDERGVCV